MDLKIRTSPLTNTPSSKFCVWAGDDRQMQCVADNIEEVIIIHRCTGSQEWKISNTGDTEDAIKKAHGVLSSMIIAPLVVAQPQEPPSIKTPSRMPFRGATPP